MERVTRCRPVNQIAENRSADKGLPVGARRLAYVQNSTPSMVAR